MIDVRKITKKYKEKTIFEHLSFSVPAGSMLAITGESGIGKTTLLNCLGQLETINEGEILINSQKISRKNRKTFFREQAGFLFQNYALIDNETVKQNLTLVSKEEQKIKESLEKFQVDHLIDKKIFLLSGGEQQRVALARLFLKEPKIIFADEPTASLDQKNKGIVLQALQELNAKGATVLVVTHDPTLAAEFDHVLDMNEWKKSIQ